MVDQPKYVVEYIKKLSGMSNNDLLTEYLDVSLPDDFGEFTYPALVRAGLCYDALIKRLKQAEFITVDWSCENYWD
jgi:hypothetical protein